MNARISRQMALLVSSVVRARWASCLAAWMSTTLLALALGGCAVTFVDNYNKESVERINEISKSVLKFYQDLLATEPSKRPAAMAGALGTRQGDVESQIRLHVLREQARMKNEDSAKIATNLLASWQTFGASHKFGSPSALSDATLGVERSILERELRAAFAAEEAKKLGGGGGAAGPSRSTKE
jgi:hypothetical protein